MMSRCRRVSFSGKNGVSVKMTINIYMQRKGDGRQIGRIHDRGGRCRLRRVEKGPVSAPRLREGKSQQCY
ncbi:hypothetical protein OPV22_008170 [Ensete ventricosum]|uniref:Uncharacterized protein n=1 Tax=Ensete ventricosum TaxID=4639 RepID=A0AAV8R2A9_ENSVE|nr:hypothetical protein OPV22_008170 [Ensete ventricosum]